MRWLLFIVLCGCANQPVIHGKVVGKSTTGVKFQIGGGMFFPGAFEWDRTIERDIYESK